MLHCPLLKMHVAVSPTGIIQPCCRFLVSEHKETFSNIQDVSLEQGMQSEGFQSAREAFARGEFPAGCASCAFEEKHGISSMREKAVRDYSQAKHLEFVELFLGNLCNMKCRTCNPLHSSKWERDAELFSWTLKSAPQMDAQKLLQSINLQHLRRLKLLGGEPFYTKAFYNIVDHISANGVSERIALELNTNASVFPSERVLEQLRHFRKIELSLSIDDIGQRAEALRTGTVWPVVSENLRQWKALEASFPNLLLNVHTTVSAYNVLYLHEVISYLLDSGFKQISLLPVKLPVELSPLRISVPQRQKAWEVAEAQLTGKVGEEFLHRLRQILLVPTELDHQEFLAYSKKLDSVRTEEPITSTVQLSL